MYGNTDCNDDIIKVDSNLHYYLFHSHWSQYRNVTLPPILRYNLQISPILFTSLLIAALNFKFNVFYFYFLIKIVLKYSHSYPLTNHISITSNHSPFNLIFIFSLLHHQLHFHSPTHSHLVTHSLIPSHVSFIIYIQYCTHIFMVFPNSCVSPPVTFSSNFYHSHPHPHRSPSLPPSLRTGILQVVVLQICPAQHLILSYQV